MRPTRLLVANVLVWGALAALLLAHGPALRWAATALPLYARGGFPPALERMLAAEALELAREPGRSDEALARIEAARAIDPNSFTLLHARIARDASHRELAVDLYRLSIRLDPSDAAAYLELAALLREDGQGEEARRLLRAGIAHLGREVLRSRPHEDPEVPAAYNEKARAVHARQQAALRSLETALRAAAAPDA